MSDSEVALYNWRFHNERFRGQFVCKTIGRLIFAQGKNTLSAHVIWAKVKECGTHFLSARSWRSVYEGRGECDDYNENLRIKLSKKQQKGFGASPRKKGGARSPQRDCSSPRRGGVVPQLANKVGLFEATSIYVSRETQEILQILIFFYWFWCSLMIYFI